VHTMHTPCTHHAHTMHTACSRHSHGILTAHRARRMCVYRRASSAPRSRAPRSCPPRCPSRLSSRARSRASSGAISSTAGEPEPPLEPPGPPYPPYPPPHPRVMANASTLLCRCAGRRRLDGAATTASGASEGSTAALDPVEAAGRSPRRLLIVPLQHPKLEVLPKSHHHHPSQ